MQQLHLTEGRARLDTGKKLSCEGGEGLAQGAQRSCGYPIPGSVQGQAGWGLEQPGTVEGVPAMAEGGIR